MRLKSSTVPLAFAVFVLVGALALLATASRFQQKQKFNGELKQLLPASGDVPGWQVTHAPIAETPEMRKRVLDILDYDDAIYVIYTKGDIRVAVYLAYWKPGRVSVRSVARHTPDVCWTLAGWNCIMREELDAVAIGDRPIGHTESRSFKMLGQTEHVAFWHLAGDEVVSFRTGGRPPWYAAIGEFARWGNQFKQEQFFLRISSNRPLPEFLETDVLRMLAKKSRFLFGHP